MSLYQQSRKHINRNEIHDVYRCRGIIHLSSYYSLIIAFCTYSLSILDSVNSHTRINILQWHN